MKRKNLKAALFPPLNIIFNRIFPFHMEDLKNLIPNCQKILTRTIPVLSKRNRKYCFDLPRIGIENHHAVGEIDRLLGNCKVLVADPVKRSFECCRILSQILLCHPKRFFFVELFSRRKIAVQQFLKRCGIFFDHIGPENQTAAERILPELFGARQHRSKALRHRNVVQRKTCFRQLNQF